MSTAWSKEKTTGPRKEKIYSKYDYVLIALTIGIAVFGIVMIRSAGVYNAMLLGSELRFVKSQAAGLLAGCAMMLFVAGFDYHIFIRMIFSKNKKIRVVHILYVIALVMQIAVLFIGVDYNGARRWLKFGPVQFQPSEITKIVVIIFISYVAYINRSIFDTFSGFLKVMAFTTPLIAVIAKENLSSAIVVAGISVGMCFIASNKNGYFVVCIVVMMMAAALYIIFGDPFRMEMIQIWLHVETNENAHQIKQGLYAIATGGLFGNGIGNSVQKLGYIPEAYNDMIFSVICEELGVVGAAGVIIAFIILFFKVIQIGYKAKDIFGTMLCAGVMLQLSIQVVINVAVVTNSIPSTGIPLPFISYGGTSAMIMMAEMGIVLGVSKREKRLNSL